MFVLPPLDYDYDALGDYISKDIMQLHHDKHHQTYVDKLNAALESHPDLAGKEVSELLTDLSSLPEEVRTAVRNHGGGHYNHSLFWQWMSPQGGGEPTGELNNAIVQKYGSYQAFVDEFTAKALAVFGSGWAWLQPDVSIITTANQDSPLIDGKDAPLLGLDVWEHAYYLDYKNKRDDYVKAWWNVVNWQFVTDRYKKS
jgi:Fe-Mn family superoxide dismutase